MRRALILAGLALLVGGGSAAAQDRDLVERGRGVAMGVTAEAAGPGSACFACHGLDGAGDSSGAFPRLSGQAGWYLYKQLKDFASGARVSEIMSPIAAALSDAEMEEVAAFYAAQSAVDARPPADVDPVALRTGAAISAGGLAATQVPACVNCHGAEGRGLAPSYPYLAGQYAPYAELQLRLFKSGERANDPLGVMRQVAQGLSEDEMRALALYFDSLAVVEPAGPDAAAAAR